MSQGPADLVFGLRPSNQPSAPAPWRGLSCICVALIGGGVALSLAGCLTFGSPRDQPCDEPASLNDYSRSMPAECHNTYGYQICSTTESTFEILGTACPEATIELHLGQCQGPEIAYTTSSPDAGSFAFDVVLPSHSTTTFCVYEQDTCSMVSLCCACMAVTQTGTADTDSGIPYVAFDGGAGRDSGI